MALLNNKKIRVLILLLILIWSSVMFWLLNTQFLANSLMVFASFLCLFAIIFERATHFVIIYLAFITADSMYNLMFVNNLPIWLIMLGILLVYLYLYACLEQKIDIIDKEKGAILVVYSLISTEVFLFLGYFFISPINRSMLLALTVYLLYGFSNSLANNHNIKFFKSYILVFIIVFVTMILTASWG